MKPIGVFNNEELFLRIAKYSNNNRIYLGIDTKDEPYADITINLPDLMVPSKEFCILKWRYLKWIERFLKRKRTDFRYIWNISI